jgi:hypothetical protein
MKPFFRLMMAVGLASGAMAALAHHSFSATYDESREVVIEGKIAQFLLRNPHSMLHVEVETDAGETIRYTVEWAGASGLTGSGVTRTTLRINDEVVIRGNPGRSAADHRVRMLSIDRPADGWHWGEAYL